MKNEWMGDSNKAIAIVRISSLRQKDNFSHDLQEKEIREYADHHGLRIVDIAKIIESAKDSDNRKKYTKAISDAFAQDVRHLLFYMYDREARNLTDNERNEKLVKSDLIVLHYVRDRKILHRGSPDSDFFIRDVQAAANKQYIRNLAAKVADAMTQKAEAGWWPTNHPPLGYVNQRVKDERGKELARGAIVVPDPNEQIIRWIKREFQLRYNGYSFGDIKKQCIAEGLVPPERLASYNKVSIEKRMKNPFYSGSFRWQGKIYPGKHELIIPRHIVEAVQDTKKYRRKDQNADFGVFAGWIKCGECGCSIVYDPKKKITPKTGAVKIFHYYHCSNGRKQHPTLAGLNISEDEISQQFGKLVDRITISKELAEEIARELNSSHRQACGENLRKVEDYKAKLKVLEAREDRAYDDHLAGILDQEGFKRNRDRIREERRTLTRLIDQAKTSLDSTFLESTESILELATQAKSLYLSRNRSERRDFLETILSNPTLEGRTLRYHLKKPFETIARMNGFEEWRTLVDDFRTGAAGFRRDFTLCVDSMFHWRKSL